MDYVLRGLKNATRCSQMRCYQRMAQSSLARGLRRWGRLADVQQMDTRFRGSVQKPGEELPVSYVAQFPTRRRLIGDMSAPE